MNIARADIEIRLRLSNSEPVPRFDQQVQQLSFMFLQLHYCLIAVCRLQESQGVAKAPSGSLHFMHFVFAFPWLRHCSSQGHFMSNNRDCVPSLDQVRSLPGLLHASQAARPAAPDLSVGV